MSKIKFLTIVWCVLAVVPQLNAQNKMKKVDPTQPVFVSDIKTTHLIFDQNITYVDLGSPYFIVDTVKTLIKLRHLGEDIKDPISLETNLTVITKDGTFHSIPLMYTRKAKNLTYRIESGADNIYRQKQNIGAIEQRKIAIKLLADQLKFAKSNMMLLNKNEDFLIGVNGIFYDKKFMALRLVLKNESAIDLEIDQILFRLKLKARLSGDYIYQERILKPVHILNEPQKIEGNSATAITFIFDKFTPNKNEVLTIDVLEKNGGRSSKIRIPRKKIINANILGL